MLRIYPFAIGVTLTSAAIFAGTPANAAEAFAPAGAKAVFNVDYIYESTGKKSSSGMYDPKIWRVNRTVSISADLAAQIGTALPTLQAVDAAQMAGISNKVDRMQSAAAPMAPMMANVEKIMAKCGDDEACMARETQKLGFAMSGTPEMDKVMKAKKDVEPLLKPDAARYQAWFATAQSGTFVIDETVNMSIPDPICARRPRGRCTREEIRKGGGELPRPELKGGDRAGLAGLGAVEVDAAKNTLTLRFAGPLLLLPYIETITSDEPPETHDTPIPKGPQKRQMAYRTSASGTLSTGAPITVPLKGGWRSQAGEQVVMLKGDFGDAGKLTIRWRFKAI